MRRIIQWLAAATRDPHAEPEAHFHRGPQAAPAVCHDQHCRIPRLDVADF
jgi:hypothetical protein